MLRQRSYECAQRPRKRKTPNTRERRRRRMSNRARSRAVGVDGIKGTDGWAGLALNRGKKQRMDMNPHEFTQGARKLRDHP